ncbi:21310_t:CDS:2, partial [Gigaspora margarita]
SAENGEGSNSLTNINAPIRRSDTQDLEEFLRNDNEFGNLNITKKFFAKLYEEEITPNPFIKLKKANLKKCGLKIGPSLEVKDYISKL